MSLGYLWSIGWRNAYHQYWQEIYFRQSFQITLRWVPMWRRKMWPRYDLHQTWIGGLGGLQNVAYSGFKKTSVYSNLMSHGQTDHQKLLFSQASKLDTFDANVYWTDGCSPKKTKQHQSWLTVAVLILLPFVLVEITFVKRNMKRQSISRNGFFTDVRCLSLDLEVENWMCLPGQVSPYVWCMELRATQYIPSFWHLIVKHLLDMMRFYLHRWGMPIVLRVRHVVNWCSIYFPSSEWDETRWSVSSEINVPQMKPTLLLCSPSL